MWTREELKPAESRIFTQLLDLCGSRLDSDSAGRKRYF